MPQIISDNHDILNIDNFSDVFAKASYVIYIL